MCGPDLTAHYRDPFDARIASVASQLDMLIREAPEHGRRVPVSVEGAARDLMRWANRSLIPRGHAVRGEMAGQEPLWPPRPGVG